MKVLIRADASHAIGSGHITRCLTLANVLRSSGAQVSFACRELSGHLLDRLDAQGWTAYRLPAVYAEQRGPLPDIQAAVPWQADISALQSVLPMGEQFDWIIVDHYGLDQQWQTAARRWAPKIAAIDDLANRPHAVDLLLDQNFSGTPAAYAPWVTNGCRTLFGPRFAMLRDEFKRDPLPIKAIARRLVVNFGGFDAAGETFKAMLALEAFPELEVDFVAGTGNPHWEQMQVMAQSRPNWRLQAHTNRFAELMSHADLFIGAGGGTSWERAALGLPTICISVAANQKANAKALAAIGAHLYLGASETVTVAALQQAIAVVTANHGLRQSFAERSHRLVDGQGAQRVAAALAGEFMQVRPATLADARVLFEGRNAQAVRYNSIDSQPIEWDRHVKWLTATLADSQRLLLIAETSDGPVGVLRYDLSGIRADVSIYLLEGRFGVGWGRALLVKGEQYVKTRWPRLYALDAVVLPGNQASINLFREAGYVQADCRFERALRDNPDD